MHSALDGEVARRRALAARRAMLALVVVALAPTVMTWDAIEPGAFAHIAAHVMLSAVVLRAMRVIPAELSQARVVVAGTVAGAMYPLVIVLLAAAGGRLLGTDHELSGAICSVTLAMACTGAIGASVALVAAPIALAGSGEGPMDLGIAHRTAIRAGLWAALVCGALSLGTGSDLPRGSSIEPLELAAVLGLACAMWGVALRVQRAALVRAIAEGRVPGLAIIDSPGAADGVIALDRGARDGRVIASVAESGYRSAGAVARAALVTRNHAP